MHTLQAKAWECFMWALGTVYVPDKIQGRAYVHNMGNLDAECKTMLIGFYSRGMSHQCIPHSAWSLGFLLLFSPIDVLPVSHHTFCISLLRSYLASLTSRSLLLFSLSSWPPSGVSWAAVFLSCAHCWLLPCCQAGASKVSQYLEIRV